MDGSSDGSMTMSGVEIALAVLSLMSAYAISYVGERLMQSYTG